jgi:hypothetical protein
MIQALGLLAGFGSGGESDQGYLFLAFRPELICPTDLLNREVTQLMEPIKADQRHRYSMRERFHSREQALHEGPGNR